MKYSMRKWNQMLNREFMQWKGKDLNPGYEHPKKVDCQGRRLWDLLGKLCLFTCSEWASEEYIGEPCNGSFCVFLDFFFFFVGSSHVFSVHWMWNFCEFVVLLYKKLPSFSGLGGGDILKRVILIFDGRGLKNVQLIHLDKTPFLITFYVMWLFRGI